MPESIKTATARGACRRRPPRAACLLARSGLGLLLLGVGPLLVRQQASIEPAHHTKARRHAREEAA
eukprot:5717533-Prymnesium_polylepis.1